MFICDKHSKTTVTALAMKLELVVFPQCMTNALYLTNTYMSYKTAKHATC